MQIRNQIKTAEAKTAGVWDYFSLGLTAFGGLGMEAVYAYFLEPFVYGAPMQEWTPVQTIIHWICICITWGVLEFGCFESVRKNTMLTFGLLADQ